jgi:taurine--2-oxoglutarate transaminase
MKNSKNIIPWSIQKNTRLPKVHKSLGSYFWVKKKKYLDFCSQLVNMNLGFQNPNIIKAIIKQTKKLCFIGPKFENENREKLADLLTNLYPGGMKKVFFSDSGARANEIACIIAKQYSKKKKILAREITSYHGATHYTASLSGDARRKMIKASSTNIIFFSDPIINSCPTGKSYPNCKILKPIEIEKIFKKNKSIAAIILEPITGSAGRIIPPKGYYESLRKICDKYDVLIIFDEVMTGFGRTGKWFGANHWTAKPDIVTLAKGITGGTMPLGATLISDKISKFYENEYFPTGLTNYAHPISCAAAIESIKIYKKRNLIKKSEKLGFLIDKKLLKMKKKFKCIGDVRGKGLFYAIEFIKNEKKDRLVEWTYKNYFKESLLMKNLFMFLWENGLFCYGRYNMLYICPPLVISKRELEKGLNIIEKGISINLENKLF